MNNDNEYKKPNQNGKKNIKISKKQMDIIKLKLKKLTAASLIVLGITKLGCEGFDYFSTKIEEDKRINSIKEKMVEEMIDQEYETIIEEVRNELYAEDAMKFINESENPDFYMRVYITDNLDSEKGTITNACDELDFMKELKSSSWLNYGFSMKNNSNTEKLCNYLTLCGYSPITDEGNIHNQLVNCTTNLSEDFKYDIVFNGIEDTKHKYYKGITK